MEILDKILPCYMAMRNQDMYELARSLHGCRETRSLLGLHEGLNIIWQDVPSIQNSIAPKNMN